MITLGIDTTAKSCSVGIVRDDEIIADFAVNCTLEHSEKLLPMIGLALSNCKLEIDDVDIFALSVGPGSFTGVRIGVATVKGLAFGRNKPCVALSSLEILAKGAQAFYPDSIICPIMDSRHNSFYNALFKNGKRLCDDRCIDIDELKVELDSVNERIVFVGDGCSICNKLMGDDRMVANDLLKYPHGYIAAQLGKEKYSSEPDGDYSDLSLAPVYLRSSQAERTKEFG